MAAEILQGYTHDQPFHLYFAALCKQNKHWGSKDRRIYKSLSFLYFRSGQLFRDLPPEEALKQAAELSLRPLDELPFEHMYPQHDMVSDGIGFDYWSRVMYTQKPMYLHLRSGSEKDAIQFLNTQQIPFEQIGNQTLKLAPDSKCDALTEQGKAWVMDLSSQLAADKVEIKPGEAVWDACSGSGGKALFLRNKYHFDFDLTCSDLRFHTLENLKARFYRSGMAMPDIELSDLLCAFQRRAHYDRIVLDAPCSGSGTWGRSPENLSDFTPSKLAHYSVLQKKIFANVIPHLKPGGSLYYMTCSVFEAENELNVGHFCKTYALECSESAYCHAKGYDSDILFYAVLIKKD